MSCEPECITSITDVAIIWMTLWNAKKMGKKINLHNRFTFPCYNL